MDAFFAAVEQLDDPSLRGKPLLIGGSRGRGVVSTASYEARPFGVGSAMPMAKAMRLCPHAIVVPPRLERYSEVSRIVMATFGDFSPDVEALSLDEAFLDMTGAERHFGAPAEMGRRLKAAVFEATGGLHVSVGVANTKYVAKVASDYDKPDGLTVVHPDETLAFLAPQPLSRLWGAGPVTVGKLEALGFRTIGDVAAADPRRLRGLGVMGEHFHRLANNLDPRRVVSDRAARSVGSERTLEHDIQGPEAVKPHLLRSADEIGRRLRASKTKARGVRVKLKTAGFRLNTRQTKLKNPTDVAQLIYETGVRLLPEFELNEPLRLVGLAAFDLVDVDGASEQLDLFDDGADVKKRRQLETALDAVRAKFGRHAVRRAERIEERDHARSPTELD